MTTETAAEVVFDGVPIIVSPGAVMTPVADTVALVDTAVDWIGSRSSRVADVGTGTGAIAVAVALRAPKARIWATDDSEAAVSVARANVARHDLQERVEVLLGNLLEPVQGGLDVVLANLPYHAEARCHGPDETANRHQPEHAIYACGDGLQLNRDLIQACRTRLDEEGRLAIQLYGSILTAGAGRARRAPPGDRVEGVGRLGGASRRGCRGNRTQADPVAGRPSP